MNVTADRMIDGSAAYDSVVHMLVETTRRAPGRVGLRCGDERLTYAEYAGCVAAFADELASLGAEGGRVCLLMSNSPDIAIATFAVQAAGAQVAPLNPNYTAYELEPILRDAAPVAIVHDEALEEMVGRLARQIGITNRIAVGPQSRRLTVARLEQPQAALRLPARDALSTLQYTGGTTGRPKGVELTHAAVAFNVAQREALLPTRWSDERILAITPLYHVYAVSMGLYLAANCAGELVILPRYTPEAVLQAVERRRITLLSGSPTIYTGLMAHEAFDSTDLSSLRLCFSGTAALPADILRRWEARTGCPICEGYGQSEAGPVLTFNPRNGIRKVGSVGYAVPRTEVEIVDVETGERKLGVGEIGEIRARGPQIMRGYRNLDEETREALREGWLYTGDAGLLDEDGYLFIRDRKKDMVVVSGYNVYPREVEEALHAHPAIMEAAVIGRPDAYSGERLVAYIVPRADTGISVDELRAHLSERLARYKIPKDIRLTSELPKTTVGKVDKKRLRSLDIEQP